MATSDYFKKKEFIGYLSNLGNKYNRPKQMAGYIGSIRDNILKPLGCEILIDDIEKAITYKNSYDKVFRGLDLISTFLKRLVFINDKKPYIQLGNNIVNKSSTRQWPTIIKHYNDFLLNCNIPITTSQKKKYNISQSGWSAAEKKLEKTIIDKLSLIGTDSLLLQFGSNYTTFLQVVLKNSYFLSLNLAKKQFKDIAEAIGKGQKLYARESKKVQVNKQFLYNSEVDGSPKTINIIEDSDGNTRVKELIEEYTGYSVSAGYKSIFQYYIISHIWGDAFDPRNFSNFWNIVIVPAWANFLLDKEGSQDELTQKMINTFKAICIKHYGMKGMKWKYIDKKFENLVPDPSYVVSGKYTINVIKNKRKGQDYGNIEEVMIIV